MITSQSTIAIAPAGCAGRPVPIESHFIIGQDASGQWLALETHRQGGGLFASRESAIHFVAFETGHRAGAYELSPTPLSLMF